MREIEITRGGFTVFARVLGDPHAPALLYLQGGPGFPAPRQRFAWITHALSRGYQVVLLDQRGTGRSTRIDAATPSLIDAKVLTQLRADEIVADAEALREEMGLKQWDVLGQSFGGFCLMHYLAAHPEGVGRALFTGGVPSISKGADEVYRATFAKLKRRHLQFNEAYPAAEAMVREVCRHLEGEEELLPTGERLSARRLRTLGIELGREGGFESLARLFEAPFHPNGRLRTDFLAEVGERVSFAKGPLYAAVHETIYGGTVPGATNWAAERVSAELEGFAPDAHPDDAEFYLTGEHIFPFQFDEDPALRPFTQVAHELAEKDDWSNLYAGLGSGYDAYAAVYTDDIFVPRELSLETASAIGAQVFATDQFQHDGLRRHGEAVLGRLLDMAGV
ncbi:alpha/beta fold hydrolase [Corynebacterium sp. HMSC034A01]|uniref:alpha/beta fold hydrolase n=1 Tax=Corynebacterium sp. HMSC034A01 TaxID=1739295 RepID=UPI000A55967F|nr:alpha/beta fold hydrolase [Corynebacterium sp. HMSC034A01]